MKGGQRRRISGWSVRCLAAAVLLAAFAVPVSAQLQWLSAPQAPHTGVAVYDRQRDRVLLFDGFVASEFDGVGWASVPFPSYPGFGWSAYDEARGRTVVVAGSTSTTSFDMIEWDGRSWHVITVASSAPAVEGAGAQFVTYHPGLGKLILCRRGSTGYDLYTWDGSTFQSLPETYRPPVRGSIPRHYYYFASLAYDRVRDKLVLFGRSEIGLGRLLGRVPALWEWDPVNGWVDQGVSGTMLDQTFVWFDEHRGKTLRFDSASTGPPTRAIYWLTVSRTWIPMWFSGTPIPDHLGAYDPSRNRFYQYSYGPKYLDDVDPASYDLHVPGCTTPGGPELELTRPHTRSWLGRTMSVDLTGLPVGVGILAMGFNDQVHAGNPLPLPLQSYGMPGCSLNVAVDAAVFARPSGFLRGTVTIPIPFKPALLGLQFYHQGFAPAPGQNPLGMLATPSMVGRIGRF